MNRIHKAKHRYTRKRSGIAAMLALLLMIGCVFFPDMEVRADSLSVRASASTVKIGDTVTISITVPAGVSATVNLTYPANLFSFQSASETANSNGGTVSMTLGGYGGTNTTTTGTVTFKATAAGSATFSASAPVAGNQEGDQVSVGGGSASVTVQNETSGGNSGSGSSGGSSSGGSGGNSSGGSSSGGSSTGSGQDDDGNKSADNSLSSLTLSAGKLSPSFQYNVVNYTATVDYSVTSVVVSAKASNANAKIESVKGGENLTVGENRIQIVVKAENGVTATYTVTVTRKAQGETDEPQDGDDNEVEPSPEPTDDEPESTDQSFVVDGRTLYPSDTIPEGTEAEGFEPGDVMLWGQTFPAYVDNFAGGALQLIYLVDENGENGGLYLVFSDNLNEAYNYICLHAERGFIILLPDGDGNAPKEYAAMPTVLDLEGLGKVDAWFQESERDFALVYAINQLGVRGWYTLDTLSLSYVRYQEPTVSAGVEEPSSEQKEEPSQDDTDGKEKQTVNHLIIGVAAIAVLIILIVIILIVVLRRGGDLDDDEQDDDDLWSDDNEAEEPDRNSDRGIKLRQTRRMPAIKEENAEQEESAQIRKRYDKSVFETDELTDIGKKDAARILRKEREADEFSAVEAGLAAEMEKEMAAELKKIADPAPMQTVSTHKDKDDEDLEFIDL